MSAKTKPGASIIRLFVHTFFVAVVCASVNAYNSERERVERGGFYRATSKAESVDLLTFFFGASFLATAFLAALALGGFLASLESL